MAKCTDITQKYSYSIRLLAITVAFRVLTCAQIKTLYMCLQDRRFKEISEEEKQSTVSLAVFFIKKIHCKIDF